MKEFPSFQLILTAAYESCLYMKKHTFNDVRTDEFSNSEAAALLILRKMTTD